MVQTEVAIILDRSGSMKSIWGAIIEGINALIEKVSAVPGETLWSLILFDDHPSAAGAKEGFPHWVFERKRDTETPKVELHQFQPRGGTALIDACVKTLSKMKAHHLTLAEPERPKVVIVTDGEENSSRECTRGDLRALIAEMQSVHKWEFVYLGANQDAFHEAQKYGMQSTPVQMADPNHWTNKAIGAGLIANASVISGQVGNLQYNASLDPNDGMNARACITSGAVCVAAWKSMTNTPEPQL